MLAVSYRGRPYSGRAAMTPPKKHKEYPLRVCHNLRCQTLFKPRRYDQLHCDRVCTDRCRPCHEIYEKDYQVRLKERKRKTQQGLKGAMGLVEAMQKNRPIQIRLPYHLPNKE